ncbi:NADH-quinone oxidoreductase subunit E [Rhodalgimonas zhirmunskyi]|uniref:NADH-quinone oxidoreductase subunit E n=1 Tax=Rhodalgimonas zhirmunskyi TaxID=2964767 RepID=A0AAJ1X5M0_9RHOB|nr:NADH-quinone oxidoreductase subunit E [Rhodoalgimonas zhirmunskyi]MDQ2095378.1 NADH-quinone oxidoreductase subunit E [Rhodoalgimonas zhirmunskyi]
MLRRLHPVQPESFAFTPENRAWAEAQVTKYPEGRQQSAIIPLLWRAQEQEGWLSRAAIEHVAEMLDLPYIRALEVATFYFMFQLQPVGNVAHFQICGTLSCMICGAEDLIDVLKRKVAAKPHDISEDGKFSWEEVECLGACANAPMAQIGKDYYEDLTPERLEEMIDQLARGEVPVPGPQNGRFASEPKAGLTSLKEYDSGRTKYNASAQLAVDLGDSVKRIDGTEVPLSAPWSDMTKGGAAGDGAKPAKAGAAKLGAAAASAGKTKTRAAAKAASADDTTPKEPKPAKGKPADKSGVTKQEAQAESKAKPAASAKGNAANAGKSNGVSGGVSVGVSGGTAAVAAVEKEPETLSAPRAGESADDLKLISGVGPKLEQTLNELGFWHFDQIANWGPEEIAWVDARLRFKGRIERDNWMDQAKILAAGGETEFSARKKK